MTFKAGQSGNPAGRPKKGKALSDELRRLLQSQAPGSKRSNLQVLVAKLVAMARKGDRDCLRYIFDRLEGRPAQSMELTGDEKRPLHITYAKGSEERQ